MTHEHHPHDEAGAGPEHDHRLPDAASIPVFSDVAGSDAPPLPDDAGEVYRQPGLTAWDVE